MPAHEDNWLRGLAGHSVYIHLCMYVYVCTHLTQSKGEASETRGRRGETSSGGEVVLADNVQLVATHVELGVVLLGTARGECYNGARTDRCLSHLTYRCLAAAMQRCKRVLSATSLINKIILALQPKQTDLISKISGSKRL